MEEILLIRTFVGELLLDRFAVLLVKLLTLFFGDSEVALLAVVVIEFFRRVEEFPLIITRIYASAGENSSIPGLPHFTPFSVRVYAH